MKPFQKAHVPQAEIDGMRAALLAKPLEFFEAWGIDTSDRKKLEERIEEVAQQAARGEHWNNDKYQVVIVEAEVTENDFPPMWHLSIKRHDRYPVFNWRDIQTIKNELVGPENEAVQLFPAESRLVDGANQYHLFCLKEPGIRFPFGFATRTVTDQSVHKSRNRPL